MKKKTFLSVVIAIFIVVISFVTLICISHEEIGSILVSLCEALFTGGIISIIPQLIDWHASESNFSEKVHSELLNVFEWAQTVDFQKQSCEEIKKSAYEKSKMLLKLQNQYVFSFSNKRIKYVRQILSNFINKIESDDLPLASRILEKDIIPELRSYVEPQS